MKKNIIFIGANGAGKTSLAKLIYQQGYHLMKLSPLSDDNEVYIRLASEPFGIVFDRWSPIDLAVYRHDESLLTEVRRQAEILNKTSIIFYLENFNEYDDSFDVARVVQRPNQDQLWDYIQAYRNYIQILVAAGIHIFWIHVKQNADETLTGIERIIKENEKIK